VTGGIEGARREIIAASDQVDESYDAEPTDWVALAAGYTRRSTAWRALAGSAPDHILSLAFVLAACCDQRLAERANEHGRV
jgi:hypothetical protein